MIVLADLSVVVVALLQSYFLVLEMFLWCKPAGLRAFAQTLEQANVTKVFAANQGLYNGFLAAGLFWGLFQGPLGFDIKLFFLACVFIAGVYGAITVSRKIFFFQGLPALISFMLVFLAYSM